MSKSNLEILGIALGGNGFEIPIGARGKRKGKNKNGGISNFNKSSPLRDLVVEFEKQYPVKVAAKFSKKEINKLTAGYSRMGRRKVKRYCRRARNAVYGTPISRKQPKRKQRKTRFTYNEYIASTTWAARKNRYYQTHKRACSICGETSFVHLHHMVYTAYDGTEPDENLTPLCDPHHKEFHAIHKTTGNMKVATLRFIQETSI